MNKLAKITILVMILTMVSKIFGFGRELVLTYVYGASIQTDAYLIAASIPGVLYESIAIALTTTFIPLFCEVRMKEGNEAATKFSNNVLNILIIVSVVLAVVGFVFAEKLVRLFAISYTGENLKLAMELTRIMIFGIVFTGASNVMTSLLQVKEKFAIPAMIGIPFNVFIILFTIYSVDKGINILAVGTLLAMISKFLFQVPYVLKEGYRYSLYVDSKDKYIKKMGKLIIPVFIGVSVTQINTIVDRSLASTLAEGSVTILNSANKLNSFVIGLFIMSISTVIYPTLSKLSNENNKEKLLDYICKSINSVIILIIPISVGAIVLCEPVVRVVFERGAFNSEATTMTAIALACYSIGMIGFGLNDILSKVFYSLQDTKTPMIIGAVSMVINIILNLVLVKMIGYAGLALATSLSVIVGILILFVKLKKRISYFGQDKIFKTSIKSIISSVAMGYSIILSYPIISDILKGGFINQLISLMACVLIGAVIYGLLLITMNVEEVNMIVEVIKCKFKKESIIKASN